MQKYNPNIHHRRSIRLKEYDYAQSGLYFITICVQNRKCLFGKINIKIVKHESIKLLPTQRQADMILNDAGKMIERWYKELENKYPDIRCHEMIIMPNHFHCILQIVGADLCVCPEPHVCPEPRVCPNIINNSGENKDSGEHTGSPLHRVIQWFKTMTTNEYICGVKTLGWQPFDNKLWQRNYYEHIIRTEQSHHNISQYIINNPAKWREDKFFMK